MGKKLGDLGLLFYPNAFFSEDPDLMPVRGVVKSRLETHELEPDQVLTVLDRFDLIGHVHVQVLDYGTSDLNSALKRQALRWRDLDPQYKFGRAVVASRWPIGESGHTGGSRHRSEITNEIVNSSAALAFIELV